MSSKGEQKIEKLLILNNIYYKKEYTFDNLKYKKLLRFDFALLDPSTCQVICLIEYDGEGHFKPIDKFGKIKGFLQGRERDRIKNEYCIIHNIPLYRIPYWDFNDINERTILSPKYRVISKWHNDRLINSLERKNS